MGRYDEYGNDPPPIDTPPVEEVPQSQALAIPTLPAEGYSRFAGAGEGAVTAANAKKLMEVFADDEHDIKPTGELFVPQVHYRKRLNEVFLPGGWGLIEQGPIGIEKRTNSNVETYAQSFHLVAGGRFVAGAIGEMDYNPRNPNTTKATALEGMKSNALMRCCKDLSIGWECWDKDWTEKWKERCAVRVRTVIVDKRSPEYREDKHGNPTKIKMLWRRKNRKPFSFPCRETGGKAQPGDDE